MRPLDCCAARKILIRAVNWLGDAVMSTPALCAVRESFPAAEITLLANPLVAQLFSPHPAVDRVLTFDRNGKHRGIAGRFRLAAELRRQGFDLAVILPNSFDSAAVPFLAGIPKRIGKSSDGRGFLLTDRCVPGSIYPPRHEVDYYLELLRCFGIRGSETIPCLTVTTAEEQAASSLLSEQGIQSSDIVLGINPGATFGSAKRWYPDRFAEAARRLAEEWSARTVIFGSGGEAPLAAEIERELGGGCVNMAGKTSVRELMALIKRCNFLITNDSGPMHIGAAFGVPLVAVFGPTDHTGTAPFSDRAVIVRKEMDCAPCKLRQCPTDHRCMTAITADDVIRAALDLAHRTGVGRS